MRPTSSVYSRELPESRLEKDALTVDGLVHPAVRPRSSITSISGILHRMNQGQPDQPHPPDVLPTATTSTEDLEKTYSARRRCSLYSLTLTLLVLALIVILALCIAISAGAFNRPPPSNPGPTSSTASSTMSSTGTASRPTTGSKEDISKLIPYITFLPPTASASPPTTTASTTTASTTPTET